MNLENSENQWFALQVRTRYEHKCAMILRSKGYEEFVPLGMLRAGVSPRSASTNRQPVFPGYVFCKLTANACGLIVTTPGVIRVVGYGRVPSAIGNEEIENIQRLVDSGRPACAWPYFSAGQRIRMMSGALRGVTGTLLRAKNLHKLIVSVDLLRRSVAVELDADCVATLGFRHECTSDKDFPSASLQRRFDVVSAF